MTNWQMCPCCNLLGCDQWLELPSLCCRPWWFFLMVLSFSLSLICHAWACCLHLYIDTRKHMPPPPHSPSHTHKVVLGNKNFKAAYGSALMMCRMWAIITLTHKLFSGFRYKMPLCVCCMWVVLNRKEFKHNYGWMLHRHCQCCGSM